MKLGRFLYLALPFLKPYTENGSTVYPSRIRGGFLCSRLDFAFLGRF